ncbi:unnamed protein product [Orchesella dallaii]|uniref:G-protein coupled receptors family 1 profile domain-containing protein n=1 Tax=Orchesella dallaii TaxID=48710 RepID=A0ABP1QIQ4_9HEXA
MYNATNVTEATLIVLPYIFCLLLDLPFNEDHDDYRDCSISNSSYCVKCPVIAKFQLDGDENGTIAKSTYGHIVSILIWLLILLFGLFGIVTNCIIIWILKRQKCTKAFDILLFALAIFDIVCSTMTVASSTGIITFFQNWNRGAFTLNWIYLTFLTSLLGRTGSTCITVVIAAERYFFIAFPNRLNTLSLFKAKLISLFVFVIAILLSIPRYSSWYVGPANKTDIPSLLNMTYVLHATGAEKVWYERLGAVHNHLDFWTPLPFLLTFTLLICWEIRKINLKKRELQVTRRKDIRAVQVFIPVIVFHFLCTIVPISHYLIMKLCKVIYREQNLAMLLSLTVNSSVNLPIYYLRASTFRKEARAILFSIIHRKSVM